MCDKSGELLNWVVTHGPVARVVPAIRDGEENTHLVLDVIAQAFPAYYQELYTKDLLPSLEEKDCLV
ncbi:hypothetical protein NDU88_002145 [Pleurodeles waltl]|uniref:Uncharacterized protein n=1 Tax=Pleurodeles waltl TaxID=8319 RepID=A0AAV7UWS5_PLEWA|nr:hypothetical protein NDU88_002145 [Pleurodeles waltl]